MKTLKTLVGVIALTFVFAFAAFADCEPPVPGQVNTPCSGAQIAPEDPVASAEQSVQSTSNSAAVEDRKSTRLNSSH